MVDLTPIAIPLERSGGWVGQPLDRLRFALGVRTGGGRVPCPPWRFHIGGWWYGGRWWSLAVASQN